MTIILPVYNGSDTLVTAIQSILSQDCDGWELLIIDDASSDDSALIVSSFEDPRITLVCHAENQGLSSTLNHGVSLIKTKYVMRMDQDDICFSGRVSAQVRYLEENPKIDLIGCRCLYFDGATFLPMGVIEVPEHHAELMSGRFSNGFALAHPSLVGKTEWFRRYPYRPDFDGAEDRELLLRAASSSTYGCVPEVLLAYRVNQLSLKNSFHRRRLLVKAVRGNGGPIRAFRALIRQCLAFFFCLCGGQKLHWHLRVKPDITVFEEWGGLWQRIGMPFSSSQIPPSNQLEGADENEIHRQNDRKDGELAQLASGNGQRAPSDIHCDSAGRSSGVKQRNVLSRALLRAFLAHGLVLGLSFTVTVLGTRFLEPDSFGRLAYSQAWLNFTVLLASVGIHTAGMAITASSLNEGRMSRLLAFFNWNDRLTSWTGVVGGCVMFGILGLAFQMGVEWGDWGWICIVSACVLPLVKANNTESIIMGFKRVVLARAVAPITQKGLQIAIILLFAGIFAGSLSIAHFYVGLLSGAIVSYLLSRFARRKVLSEELSNHDTRATVRDEGGGIGAINWWHICLPQLATGISLWAGDRTDFIVLGMFRSMEELAVYEIAYRIAALLAVVPMVVSFVAGPLFAENAKPEKIEELQRSVGLATLAGMLGIGSGTVVLFIWGESILGLFGTAYLASFPILRILIFGVLCKAFFGPALVVLNMAGRGRQAMKVMLWAVLLNVCMAFGAIPVWGAFGAAWATVTAGVFSAAWLSWVAYRELGVVPFFFGLKKIKPAI